MTIRQKYNISLGGTLATLGIKAANFTALWWGGASLKYVYPIFIASHIMLAGFTAAALFYRSKLKKQKQQ
ncbi:MAG: hypothetical protein FWF97_03635 [Alphaproteobacteria bacterium]|nr:hypothetical protein [Alphaproteobacteria bacterium]